MKPWERQQNESAKAFDAFSQWLPLGVNRSLTPVAATLKKSVPLLSRWAKMHKWHDRALAWDNAQNQARAEGEFKGIAKVAEKAAAKRELTNQVILDEANNLAFSRITDVVNWEGVNGLTDSKLLPDYAVAAIESVQIERDPKTGEVTKHRVKFHSKLPPLDRLGQHKKLWGPKEDTAGSVQNQNFLILIQHFQATRQDLRQDFDDWQRGKDEK